MSAQWKSGIGHAGRLLLWTLAAYAASLQAEPLHFEVTETYYSDGNNLVLNAINNAGMVVGSQYSLFGGVYLQYPVSGTAGKLEPAVDLTELALSSHATAINGAGELAGQYAFHATVFNPNGQQQDLGTLGGFSSSATAINNQGHVAGTSFTSTGGFLHSFLYANGVMKDIGTLDQTGLASSAEAFGMNGSDQIVGRAGVVIGTNPCCTYATHAFLYSNGVMTDLGVLPGGTMSSANAINDLGQIVGDSWVNGNKAFIDQNGLMRQIPLPGNMNINSLANGINNHGYVVGQYVTVLGDLPFIYGLDGQTSYDLNDLVLGPHVPLGPAVAINDNNQILALLPDSYGGYVVLSPVPVPEPKGWLLVLVGLGVLTALSRKAHSS